jgi:ubiquinone/menaquinone biosynthesis C-methylase UbiE
VRSLKNNNLYKEENLTSDTKIKKRSIMEIKDHIKTRTKCPLCLSQNISSPIPPHNDLKFPVLPVCVEIPREEDLFAPFNICMCKNCGLIMLKEVVDPEILYKIFHSDGIGKVWGEHYSNFADLIKKHAPSGRILEVGAGQGKLISKLLSLYPSGVEVMDPLYEGPSENVRVHRELLTEESARKLPEEFDAVISSHTLEHFLEFKEYFESAWKVLKKGGLLFTSIPNQESSFSKGYGNQLNFEHPSVCMNAHWIYLHYKYGFAVKEIYFFKDHSVQIVGQKVDVPIDFHADVKELSENILDQYWESIKKRMDKIEQFAKPDKDNWIFGASNLSQPLFVYGLSEKYFKGVLDNSPLKHNKRLYGTNLICRKPEEIVTSNKDDLRVFLNVAQYNREVYEQLKELNPNIECISL